MLLMQPNMGIGQFWQKKEKQMATKHPLKIVVSGAAGAVAYALLPRIASGEMFGHDQPVFLQLLEVAPAMRALDGVAMELDDCSFPLLSRVSVTDDLHGA